MTSIDEIFELLASRFNDQDFARADPVEIDKWANELGLSLPDFLNSICIKIAQEYQAGERSFEFCDFLVNDLYAALINRAANDPNLRWPATFDEVYQAFDGGEFYRTADQSDDPIKDFTDPLIATFLAKLDRPLS